jgi:hypothetical protein
LYFELLINIFALGIKNRHGQRVEEEKEVDKIVWVEEDIKDEDLDFETMGSEGGQKKIKST